MQSTANSYVYLGLVALCLGIINNVLFYERGIGLNVPIFTISIIVGGVVILYQFGRHLERRSVMLFLVPTVLFSSMVFLRSSDLLTLFNILASVLLLLIFVSSFVGKSFHTYLPADYLKIFILPLKFLKSLLDVYPKIFSFRKVAEASAVTREVLRGSLLAIAAIVAFSFLFASADDVFRSFIPDLLQFKLNAELVNRFCILVFTTAALIGAFGYMFNSVGVSSSSPLIPKERKFGAIETTILLGAVNALFLVFILLQLTYLFGGESRVAALGITYADYARKGFFELILAAILSFIIISAAEKRVIKKEESHTRSFKILSIVLILQVVLVLASAFTRLVLYENAYGFTDIRLYSHALMIWIGLVLALLAYHILSNGKYEAFAHRVFLLAILFLFGMNILNPEAFIARHNIRRYENTGKLDTAYLAHLSDDALPETIALLDNPDEKIRNPFAKELYWARNYGNRNDTDWASLRLPRIKAQKLIAPKRAQLEANKDILTAN